ncbi:MAG: DNA repair protein RadC [Oscillospiraceae bacterium]|jgi:DNA repair protein RadC|nr:DNA repair protein RadC [Oscillospiraceae bacterium]
MPGNLHRGHRLRVKAKFADFGLDSFSEHEILELLLFYSIPQGDTNETAHRLINRFGSLAEVLDAPLNALTAVKGIGINSAALIKLVPSIARRYSIEKTSRIEEDRVISPDDAGRYILPYFASAATEETCLLLLTAVGNIISCRKIFDGSINATEVSRYKIVRAAIEANAAGVVLAHNHPSGIAIPGKQDIAATTGINAALKLVGIKLVDHIIVAGNDWVSMRQSRMMD